MIPKNIQQQIDKILIRESVSQNLKLDARATYYTQRLISRLVKNKKMEFVWRQMDENSLEVHSLLSIIEAAAEWPGFVTDLMSPGELDDWNKQVAAQARKLARMIDGSRINGYFLLSNLEAMHDSAEGTHITFPLSALSTVSEMLYLVAKLEERGLDPDNKLGGTLPRHAKPSRPKKIMAQALTEWVAKRTGKPRREMVAAIIAALYGGGEPDEKQIRRWAPWSV